MISNDRTQGIDFSFVYVKANEILLTSSAIEVFPFKMGPFIKEQSDIRLCSYRKAKEKYGVDISAFGSDSAILQELCGACIIFYNQDEPDYRVRFSIMHEYAHYYLRHEMNLKKTDPRYQRQEIEANCFSAQILMPEQMLRAASKRGYTINVDYIMKSFGVSEDAAQRRRATLAKYDYEWRKRAEKEYDDLILMKYAKVIDNIAAQKQNRFCDFEEEYERQVERNAWLDTRSKWS